MRVSFVTSCRDNAPTAWDGTWSELCANLRGDRKYHAVQKDGRGICPATFDGLRKVEAVRSLELLALDVDESPSDWLHGPLAPLFEYQSAVYSSWSHQAKKDGSPPCPRFRVLLPLSRPVDAEEYRALFLWVGDRCAWAGIDRACKDPSRLFYTPRARNPDALEEPFWWENHGGPLLDPDDLEGRSVAELIAAEKAEAERRKAEARPPASDGDGGRDGKWFEAALRGCCDEILRATEGDRHRMIFHQAAKMAELDWVGRGGEARAALEGAACAVLPADRHKEAVRTVAQAYAKGLADNPQRPRPEMAEAPRARLRSTTNTATGATSVAAPPGVEVVLELAERLLRTATDKPRAVASNTALILRHDPDWQGVLAINERREQLVVLRPPPFVDDYRGRDGTYPRPWRDADIARTQVWAAARWGYAPPKEHVQDAAIAAGDEVGFDPVRDYLEGLSWDGDKRTETVLCRYLGVDDTPLHRAMARAWMISAVARTFAPGCKVDHMLVVQGAQGLGKSSFFRTLCGEPYFLDHMPRVDDKDAKTALRGPWIIEFAELAGMNHAQQEHTKAFLTTQIDRYRPSYARNEIESPRRCVFAGTTNQDQFLRDDTGARRFWCVTATRQVDLVGLFGERDQLWAEAVADYRDGVPWHLSGELEAEAREAAEARYVADPWIDLAAEWCEGRRSFTAREFATEKLDMAAREIHRGTENRISAVFRELGFARMRIRGPDGREWRWLPKSEGPGDE